MAYRYSQFFDGPSGSPYGDEDEDSKRKRDDILMTLVAPPAKAPPINAPIDSARKDSPLVAAAPKQLPKPSAPTARDDEAAMPDAMKPRDEGTDWGDAITNYGVPALAGLLDIATNKGRGLGSITEATAIQANQRAISRKDTAHDQLEFLAKDAERKQRGQYYDYLDRSLVDRSGRGAKAQEIAGDREKRLRDADSRAHDVNSDEANAFREYAAKNSQNPDQVRKDLADMGVTSMRTAMPNITKQWDLARAPQEAVAAGQKANATGYGGEMGRTKAELQTAPEVNANTAAKAGLVADATEGSKVRVAGGIAAAKDAATEGSPRQRREGAQKFQKEHDTDLDIAGLMDEVDKTPGGYAPKSIAERFDSTLTARGIPKERLPAWTAKKLILEEWSRSQSGAAISKTEDGKFISQIGANPTASEDQVNAAYSTMKGLIGKRLRGGMVGNPAAKEVLGQYVTNPEEWTGGPGKDPSAPVGLGASSGAGGVSQANGKQPMSGGVQGPPAPAAGQGGATRMRSQKSGAVKMVPAAMVEEATANGWVAM